LTRRKDFAPVATLGFFDLALISAANGRFHSLQEMLAYAKANPGKLNVATINIGSTQHLTAELLKTSAGVDFQVVPFNGSPAVITALRGGQVDVAVEILGPMMGQITSKTLRPLAVMGFKRAPGLPNVPTVREGGVSGFNVASWNALAAPANTPPEVIATLNREIGKALASADLRKQLAELNVAPAGGTPEQLRDLLLGDQALVGRDRPRERAAPISPHPIPPESHHRRHCRCGCRMDGATPSPTISQQPEETMKMKKHTLCSRGPVRGPARDGAGLGDPVRDHRRTAARTQTGLTSTYARSPLNSTVVQSGVGPTSRWGLRGSEDLGGGLRATFNLEGGINVDTGAQANATTLFDRASVVGLAGNWGSITAGRQNTLIADSAGVTDPIGLRFASMNPNIQNVSSGCPPAASAAARRGGDVRDEVDQQAVVGHVVLQVRVRPVGAPQHAVGEALDHLARERHHVAVGVALAVQRRRAGDTTGARGSSPCSRRSGARA
jgi:hypothetical protein